MIPIPPPGYGAVEKHIWNLARALEGRGHHVDIIGRSFGQRAWNEYRFALWARKRAAGHGGILHLHTTGVAFTFHLLGPRDYVYTSHSRHWTVRRGLGEHLGFALERRAVAGARRVIALSQHMAELMAPVAKAEIVPNGVDTELYRPNYGARGGTKAVAVGRVEPHKGFHLAARALEGLGVTLTIIGPIPRGRYADRLRRYPWVKLEGQVDEGELIRHLATSDVYVHASSSEAFSLAVIEAMASGLPVVGTDVCAGQVEEGDNGYLVHGSDEPELVQGLRDRLSRLIVDGGLRERMALRSRALAEARYRWPLVAASVEQVYRLALEPTSPPEVGEG